MHDNGQVMEAQGYEKASSEVPSAYPSMCTSYTGSTLNPAYMHASLVCEILQRCWGGHAWWQV